MLVQCIDSFVQLPSTTEEITKTRSGSIDDWLMIDAERCAFLAIMTKLKPRCAIEVGVYRPGALRS